MVKDTPWAPKYTHYDQPPRRRFPFRLGIGIAAAIVLVGLLISLIGGTLPTESTDPTGGPTAPVSPVPAEPTAGSGAAEGVDYTLTRNDDGDPVRWACGVPITVATSGEVPEGTQSALTDVVELLAEASGLGLTVGPAGSSADISVFYAAPGADRNGMRVTGEKTLGVGGPTYRGTQIVSGTVVIRNDSTRTDPETPAGRTVLAHEIVHTLGLRHAQQHTGALMTPTLAPNPNPTLAPGDLAGLTQVGC